VKCSCYGFRSGMSSLPIPAGYFRVLRPRDDLRFWGSMNLRKVRWTAELRFFRLLFSVTCFILGRSGWQRRHVLWFVGICDLMIDACITSRELFNREYFASMIDKMQSLTIQIDIFGGIKALSDSQREYRRGGNIIMRKQV
jgi:hypothetical protein